MDTLAHGLWGGAAFGQRKNIPWKWAFWLGMAPDLLSFGPYFLTHISDIGERWMHRSMGPPDPRTIPSYVYHAYNVTHSLVVWSALVGVVYGLSALRHARHPEAPKPNQAVWPLGAWGLHILCDIPTHSTRFFPTPYLWPLQTPFVNGRPWARERFMLVNYLLIGATYFILACIRGRNQKSLSPTMTSSRN